MYRILVADDHYAVRQGLLQILRDAFPLADLGEAADTGSLVQSALSGDWNLVVTDLVMPGGGALQAIKLIKLTKPTLPFIVVSTHPGEVYGEHTRRGGADYFVAKDLVSTQLTILVRQLLEKQVL